MVVSTTANDVIDIHPWEQFVFTLRTNVASLHHNVSAALAETFSAPWRPTGDQLWLLGRKYEPRDASGVGQSSWVASEASTTKKGEPVSSSEQLQMDDSRWLDQLQDDTSSPANERMGPSQGRVSTSGGWTDCGSTHDNDDEDFDHAWAHIARMTYRKGFAPMYRCVRKPATNSADERKRYIRLTSDAGWGCMIRVGQMLLATALRRHRKDFICPSKDMPDEVGSLFLDDRSPERSPFSIFGFIHAARGGVDAPPGEELAGWERTSFPARHLTQKLPGDWFGPTTISETIAALVERVPEHRDTLSVYVNADGVLYEDEVYKLMSAQPQDLGNGVEKHHSCYLDGDYEIVKSVTINPDSVDALSPHVSMLQTDSHNLMASDPESEFIDMVAMENSQELLTDVSTDTKDRDGTAPTNSVTSVADPSMSQSKSSKIREKAVLLLFPMQLGIDKNVNEVHIPSLLRYFELPSSLGAMGGRPRMAHYFVGKTWA